MSSNTENDELLSGYLDNQLNADELQKVRDLLPTTAASQRLEQLDSVRRDLRALAKAQTPRLPSNFASRVVAQLPVANRGGSRKMESSWNWKPLAAAFATAAVVMIGISAKQFLQPEHNELPGQNLVSPVDPLAQNLPVEDSIRDIPTPNPMEPANTKLVRRQDLDVHYIMTLDLELAEGASLDQAINPLLQQHGIEIIKGVLVNSKIEEALDEVRVTLPQNDSVPSSEIYFIRAADVALDGMLEAIRADLKTFPVARFGMAYELPNDPLLDKLSTADGDASLDALNSLAGLNGTLRLGQAMADGVSGNVDESKEFATPLVAQNDQEYARPSPFQSIPFQGTKLTSSQMVGASRGVTKPTSLVDKNLSFLLLIIRQP